MFGPLRDLPEFLTGGLIAAAAWYGVSYVILAPRAMSEDAEAKFVPACLEQLESEQDRALSEAGDLKERERANRVSDLRRTIRSRTRQIREAQTAMAQYRAVRRQFRASGLDALLPPPPPDILTEEDIASLQQEVTEAETALNSLPPITLPRLGSDELAGTCACAAIEGMAGRRADYALSLASFRIVTPESVSAAKNDVSRAVRFSACGSRPWEDL